VGHGFGFQPFAVSIVRLIDVIAAVLALVLCLAMLPVSRWLRSKREQRELFVYQLAPRTRREWAWWVPTVLVAGVAEEVAYRGVTMTILWYALGNPWAAALVCAVAFALAHATQGWKSGVIIFVIGLLMHGLVAITGTLVPAMIVHVAYNLIAGGLIAREARRLDQANRRHTISLITLPSTNVSRSSRPRCGYVN
jgi:membrane protease YdiL (CAAX protease family)